jgi:hypothetical protein
MTISMIGKATLTVVIPGGRGQQIRNPRDKRGYNRVTCALSLQAAASRYGLAPKGSAA